jgi:glycosyltransferase involved in cell wall biosynthesis
MRIAWDARPLSRRDARGIGNYARCLLRELVRLEPNDEFLLFHSDGSVGDLPPSAKATKLPLSAGYRYQLWERLVLPTASWLNRAQMIHSLANTTPPSNLVPRCVSVHDLIPYMPELGDPVAHLPYHRQTVPEALRTAPAVIVPSESTRRDLLRLFGVDEKRIHVIPLASNDAIRPVARDRAAPELQNLGITPPYFLGLAATAPRKNTALLVRGFAMASATNRDHSLVLTGVDRHLESTIRSVASSSGLGVNRLHLLPFVDDHTLSCLFSYCTAFLFPSRYEGFGLPIVEAMSCGAPVVASRESSCPEVGGDAPLYLDALSDDAMADAVSGIITLSAPARDRMIQAGFRQAKRFSWRYTASATKRVYELFC